MERRTPPKDPTSKQVPNTDASSQKDPGQGEKEKTVKATPGGRTAGAGGMGKKMPPATSVHPEVSDALLVALRDASIVDEHRALMGAVIEKIQSTENGLNEACISLIKGFEVCYMSYRRVS